MYFLSEGIPFLCTFRQSFSLARESDTFLCFYARMIVNGSTPTHLKYISHRGSIYLV